MKGDDSMKKKFVAIILNIVMLSLCIPANTFAEEGNHSDCIQGKEHQYVEVPAQNGTCTQNGWEAYQKCLVCDKTIPEVIVDKPSYGHQYNLGGGKCFWCGEPCKHDNTYYIKEKQPTCEGEGWEEHRRCYTCNSDVPENYEMYEPLEHDYVNGVCTRCEVDKCNHEIVETFSKEEPTCTREGHEEFVWCQLCYQDIPEEYEWLNPLGHNYVDGICTRCEKVQIEVARIGNNVYKSLEDAVEAAKEGDTIHLLSNVFLNEALVIDKSITIDGESGETELFPPNYTIDSIDINALKLTGDIEVNLKNLNIQCLYSIVTNLYDKQLTLVPPVEAGTILIGDGNVNLSINEALVYAGGGVSHQTMPMNEHEKCIVVLPQMGAAEKVEINITKTRLWSQGSTGTGVLTFRPVELILSGKSEVYGSIFYATYLAEFKKGSAGSVVNITDTSFAGKGEKNDGVFVFEENDITVNIKNTTCQINRGPLFKWNDEKYTGSKIIVDNKSVIENLYRADLAANYNKNHNSILLYGPEMYDMRENRMQLPENMCMHVEFVDELCVDCGHKYVKGVLGDATGEGTVDTSDAQAIFNYFMGTTRLSEEALALVDINGDNMIDTSDAQAVFNIFMGIS